MVHSMNSPQETASKCRAATYLAGLCGVSGGSGNCPAAERASPDIATSSTLLGDVNVRCRSAFVALQKPPTAYWQTRQLRKNLSHNSFPASQDLAAVQISAGWVSVDGRISSQHESGTANVLIFDVQMQHLNNKIKLMLLYQEHTVRTRTIWGRNWSATAVFFMAEYLTDFATDTGSNHTGAPAAAAEAAQACRGKRLTRHFDRPQKTHFSAWAGSICARLQPQSIR